jgi:hypothetical protein
MERSEGLVTGLKKLRADPIPKGQTGIRSMYTLEKSNGEVACPDRVRYPFATMGVGDNLFIDDFKKAESARVAPKPLPTPFTLLDADDDDDETAGDSPSFNQAASDVALALVEAPRRSLQMASREAGPPHALGGQMAHRVLRDALALQLARRGFDGLRNTALWLVAELAADFIKALGAQLAAQPAHNDCDDHAVRSLTCRACAAHVDVRDCDLCPECGEVPSHYYAAR